MLLQRIIVASLLAIAPTLWASTEFPKLEGKYFGQKTPGDKSELFAPGIVSTGLEHSAVMFTPDGNELWFARMFPNEIWFSQIRDGRWTAPQVAPFCDEHGELYPVLSPDGNRIFYTSRRPITRSMDPLFRGAGHIWYVDRDSTGWSTPTHIGQDINFARIQSTGSVTSDGTLFFSAHVRGRSNTIFSASPTDSGFGPPEIVEDVASDKPDFSPFVAPDGSYMVFASFRSGEGMSDLFVSFRTEEGGWSEPVNLGSDINSPYKEGFPRVSPDGQYLFFTSNRPSALNDRPIPDGPGNIWWVKAQVLQKLQKKAKL